MHISLSPETIFYIGKFPITNTLLTSWITMLILIGITFLIFKKIQLIPKGLQNIIEILIENILKLIQSITNDKKQTEKFFPLVATIFIFILLANWIGIFPGIGTIGFKENETFVPLFRSVNSDLNMTIALALVSVFACQFFGIIACGFLKYVGKFINFKNPITFFVGVLELISEIAKLISFSFRLFGNVFAGEVLLVVIAFLIPFIAPLPFMALELFVGFVQALVFAMLTLVFLKMATMVHEEEH
ncbi:MAG: F0F1 ATP synthase subunit A [Candidatus Kuenenbacteria bacterium]